MAKGLGPVGGDGYRPHLRGTGDPSKKLGNLGGKRTIQKRLQARGLSDVESKAIRVFLGILTLGATEIYSAVERGRFSKAEADGGSSSSVTSAYAQRPRTESDDLTFLTPKKRRAGRRVRSSVSRVKTDVSRAPLFRGDEKYGPILFKKAEGKFQKLDKRGVLEVVARADAISKIEDFDTKKMQAMQMMYELVVEDALLIQSGEKKGISFEKFVRMADQSIAKDLSAVPDEVPDDQGWSDEGWSERYEAHLGKMIDDFAIVNPYIDTKTYQKYKKNLPLLEAVGEFEANQSAYDAALAELDRLGEYDVEGKLHIIGELEFLSLSMGKQLDKMKGLQLSSVSVLDVARKPKKKVKKELAKLSRLVHRERVHEYNANFSDLTAKREELEKRPLQRYAEASLIDLRKEREEELYGIEDIKYRLIEISDEEQRIEQSGSGHTAEGIMQRAELRLEAAGLRASVERSFEKMQELDGAIKDTEVALVKETKRSDAEITELKRKEGAANKQLMTYQGRKRSAVEKMIGLYKERAILLQGDLLNLQGMIDGL